MDNFAKGCLCQEIENRAMKRFTRTHKDTTLKLFVLASQTATKFFDLSMIDLQRDLDTGNLMIE